MGSVAKHRHKTTLRTLLIASGLAVAVLAACVWAAVASGGGSQASQAALAVVPPPTAPQPDPVATRTPDRASRDDARTPLPTPTPERKVIAKAKPKPKRTAYRVLSSGSCQASYYGEPQATASGEPFNPNALTAAHKTLPMGSKVRVTNVNNGQTVLVRINDRGPYIGGRCLDLSTAAMKAVGGIGSGVIQVKYQVLSRS